MSRARNIRFALLGLAVLLVSAPFAMSAQSAPAPAKPVNVPILMYHYIRVNPDPNDAVGADLSVTPWRFGQQLDMLSEYGYHTITLDELYAAIHDGAALPSNPIVITFDDGYDDLYTTAYPLLFHYRMKATSFVITGLAGQPGYITWDQMRRMQSVGTMQFESHTVDHLELPTLSDAQVSMELTASKMALEQQLGRAIRFFSYPVGRNDARTQRLVAAAGYVAAVSTDYGTMHDESDLLAMPRVRIHGDTSLLSFASMVGITLKTVPGAR